jgi:2,4-didehydro-3-deoxy-L-rhamnonate hydrolase
VTGDQPRGEVLDEVCGKIRRPPTIICRLFDDGTTADVAEATEFCADLPESISAAAGLAAGTRSHAEIAEVPAVRPSARVLCVGLDYRLHAAEVGLTIPECPALFGRWTPSLVAGDIPVPVPFGEPGLDWEVELAVVVGRPLHRVDAAAALGGVFGYAAFNDLSAREHRMHPRLWTLGKNADRSGPISPIVTAGEVGDPTDGLRLGVQGQRRGDAGREHCRHDLSRRRHPDLCQRGAHPDPW